MKKTYLGLRKKLLSALAMLLVATILMVSSTYAWFVLSTAPEVTGIQTQVGANGSLEIALVNQASWDDLTKLDMGDIDESATENLGSANLTWGNLVNLSDASYGLRNITLNPARLAIAPNGNNTDGTAITYTIGNSLLKVPVYTEDGRVQRLDTATVVDYIYDGKGFTTEGYGVRAVGTASQMSQFQLGMNAARSNIANHRAAAKTTASNTLNNTGAGLGSIVVQYALNGKTDGYTTDDVATIQKMAEGLQDALDEIEVGLRAVFAGYITTAASGVTSTNYDEALEEINNTDVKLEQLMTKYISISGTVPAMQNYVTTLASDQAKITNAIKECKDNIAAGGNVSWDEIKRIVAPLVSIDEMTMGGVKVGELKDSIKGTDGKIDVNKALALLKDMEIVAPSGSGVISDIADYVGDYSAKVTVKGVSYQDIIQNQDVDVKVTTQTTQNPVYLTAASNQLSNAKVTEATDSNSLTDFFGYAIDLAFRTNAEDAKLQLQTEPKQRIYDTSDNADTLGGGSYMSFRSDAGGLSATKMVRLMSGIRVVFMDKSNNVLAIAALDTTLGKDLYVKLSDDKINSTGKYAYLNASEGEYQQSDLIDATTYNGLPDKSSVQYKDGTLSAKLYIVSFEMTKSTAKHADDGTYYTGGISITGRSADSVIMSLKPDEATIVTALVYLDGSVVNNSMVAANATQSMSGVLNLQFSSSAELIPMQYTPLQNGGGETETPGAGGGSETPDASGENTGN